MIEITDQYIPSLNEHLSIIPFDKSSYLICVDNDKPAKLKISSVSKLLIDQIDGKKNIEEIQASFNEQTGANFSRDTIIKIFNNHFLGFGVLKNDGVERIRVKDNYLKLRLRLFSDSLVKQLVRSLLFLFDKKVFSYVFIACALFLTGVYVTQLNFKSLYAGITPSFTAWFIGLNVVSIVFHELGHAGACERFGARSGAIGFGFYLFTPVFYADVSDAWRLRRNERLIVDLAGIYMQVIFCTLFSVVYLLSGNPFFLHIAFLISATILVNINPFLRYDGYWALCDLINVPNLRENSVKLMKQFFRRVIGKANSWKPSGMNIFLMVYALVSSVFMAYFLFHMVVFQQNSIFYFPVNLYRFFERIVTDFPNLTFDWLKSSLTGFLLPCLFYLFLYRVIIKRFITYLKTRNQA